jgi:hypothetical protein
MIDLDFRNYQFRYLMDDIDSGRASEPTTLAPRTAHHNHNKNRREEHHHHGRNFRGFGRRHPSTPDPATAGLDAFDPSGRKKWQFKAILHWLPTLPGRFFIDWL